MADLISFKLIKSRRWSESLAKDRSDGLLPRPIVIRDYSMTEGPGQVRVAGILSVALGVFLSLTRAR